MPKDQQDLHRLDKYHLNKQVIIQPASPAGDTVNLEKRGGWKNHKEKCSGRQVVKEPWQVH